MILLCWTFRILMSRSQTGKWNGCFWFSVKLWLGFWMTRSSPIGEWLNIYSWHSANRPHYLYILTTLTVTNSFSLWEEAFGSKYFLGCLDTRHRWNLTPHCKFWYESMRYFNSTMQLWIAECSSKGIKMAKITIAPSTVSLHDGSTSLWLMHPPYH